MESIFVCFVSLALIIISTVTMTMSTVNSAAKLADTWKSTQQRTNSIQRTEITSIPPANYSGGIIDLVVKNTGQENVIDFSHWDVIAEKVDSGASYFTYSATNPPGLNQWSVKGIYIADNVPETFDLNVLNPGEQAIIQINPDGMIDTGQTIKITLSTAGGVTSQCFVTQQTFSP